MHLLQMENFSKSQTRVNTKVGGQGIEPGKPASSKRRTKPGSQYAIPEPGMSPATLIRVPLKASSGLGRAAGPELYKAGINVSWKVSLRDA